MNKSGTHKLTRLIGLKLYLRDEQRADIADIVQEKRNMG